ncbi:hypothetical protein VCHENC02_5744B, partial [Vibrio harveyi]
KKSP